MPSSDIDYSIHYRKWNGEGLDYLRDKEAFYNKLLGDEISSLPAGSEVLDYGCGFGALTFYLRSKGFNALGVDASTDQIAVAKRNQLPVQHVGLDGFETWCKEVENRFDAVFLMDVLEHIQPSQQISFLTELARTLKEEGVIYIKVPNANSPLASRWRYIDWTHTSSFTEHSLEFVCINAGFGRFEYLTDDSSLLPRFRYVPRTWTIRYWLKVIFRSLWKLYLWAEHGFEAKKMPLGLNIFVKAQRTEK